MRKIAAFILAFVFALSLCSGLVGCSSGSGGSGGVSASTTASSATASSKNPSGITVSKDGEYTDKDHVALYIHEYGTVPGNYITKTKAPKPGWVNTEGNLWDVLPGKSIGGGGFENDEGLLPDAPGRKWYECDIDYQGGKRNAKRIVYSNDGLIYYTGDHYNTFEQLY